MQKQTTKKAPVPKSIINTGWILVLGAIMPMLDSTMVNIAINHLSRDFNTGLDAIQWVTTGYVLATAIFVPIAGWAIQRYDGKQLVIGANVLFLLGSILSGLSWNIESMIVFRIIQGAAAGFILPLMSTLMAQTAGSKYMGRVMSIVGIPVVLGPILGPVLGAIIIQNFSWRWIFFVNVPVGIIAIILMTMKLRHFTPINKAAKFDFVGITLLALTSSSLIYGITQAAKNATFNNSSTISFLIAGVVILLAYVGYAAYKKNDAILPLHLFKMKSFDGAMIGLFLTGIATNGPMLLLPLFFQNIKGFSVINAGLMLISQGVGMLVARPLIGNLTDKLGARTVVMVSLVFTIAGSLPFIYFDGQSSLIWISIALFIRGIGIGGVAIPMMTDAYTGMEKGT
ncbi:DHA2 family efflux MFS transporter permease subunit [Lacticaseibacillus saniviri]|uniref:DHA2 family efflux MFS transporter permease subunit n=1 Tax=Lacticaseibacillus saniviri TaxID=931533 RepID=UPI000AA322AC|nr:DHA2 family efflux MFS transporter permease subunit [Lacticaseibacillus saniviri]